MTFDESIQARITTTGAVAVLTIDDAAMGVPLARALLDGGIDCMELTLRTPAALQALSDIKSSVPEMIAGVGTILTTDQVKQSIDAGAEFGVSPGLNRNVVSEASRLGLPFAPGAATPSEIEAAIELGCRLIKFFPAEPCGGLAYLESASAPYDHLGILYIPLGGINPDNAVAYLAHRLIAAIGGSFIASRKQIRERDWGGITGNAKLARTLVESARCG